MINSDENMKLVPELYAIENENITAEYNNPGSQNRIALGRCPFLWAQSLYVLGKLLQEVRHSVVLIKNINFNYALSKHILLTQIIRI